MTTGSIASSSAITTASITARSGFPNRSTTTSPWMSSRSSTHSLPDITLSLQVIHFLLRKCLFDFCSLASNGVMPLENNLVYRIVIVKFYKCEASLLAGFLLGNDVYIDYVSKVGEVISQ